MSGKPARSARKKRISGRLPVRAGGAGRGLPARRAGATLVTSGLGAEDGWGDPATGPASLSLHSSTIRPLTPAADFFVWIERFLTWTQFLGHVLQVDTNARPRVKPPAHRIDEHVRWLKMRGSLRMACTPSLEPRKRVVLLLGAPDLDERALRYSSP